MKFYRWSIALPLVFAFLPLSMALAANYPDEFADFFVVTQKGINVQIAGSDSLVIIDSTVNFQEIKIDHIPSREKLTQFLLLSGVKSDVTQQIIRDLEAGVITDKSCTESLETCAPGPLEAHPLYVYDFDISLLRIFIPSKAFVYKDYKTVIKPAFESENAINNWSQLHAYGGSGKSISWQNETTIGLPYGYVFIDSQLNSNRENELYKAYYSLDYDVWRLDVGSSDQLPAFNSTAFQDNTMAFDYKNGVTWGSSSNLMLDSSGERQRYYFNAPQSGVIEFYRDSKLLLSKSVSSGFQSIGYNELPRGVYEVTIQVKVGTQVIQEETKLIVNQGDDYLSKGEMEYTVSSLEFDDTLIFDRPSSEKKRLYRANAAYGLQDNVTVHAGVMSTFDEAYYQAGGQVVFNDDISADYLGGMFDRGGYFQYAGVQWSPIYLSARTFRESNEFERTLSNKLYGDTSFDNISIGMAGSLFGGLAFINWSIYNIDPGGVDEDGLTSVSASWNYALPKGSITVYSDYQKQSELDSKVTIGLTYTLPLSDLLSVKGTVTTYDGEVDSYLTTASLSGDHNDWTLGTDVTYRNVSTVSPTQAISEEYNFAGSANGHSDQVNGNVYGFLSDRGNDTYSATLSGTQLFSFNRPSQGVQFTYQKSQAFARVDTGLTDGRDDGDIEASLVEYRGGTKTREVNGKRLLPLDPYGNYQMTIASSGNAVIEDDFFTFDAHPGGYYEANAHAEFISVETVVLERLDTEPVERVQCVGAGCVSVEPLVKGVFRVSYKQNKPFRLVSRKGLCIYTAGKTYASGVCLPGIGEPDTEPSWRYVQGESKDNEVNLTLNKDLYYYLGSFPEKKTSPVTDKLLTLGIAYRTFSVDNMSYIYIIEEDEFTQTQKDALSEMEVYVYRRDADSDLFTSILQGDNE